MMVVGKFLGNDGKEKVVLYCPECEHREIKNANSVVKFEKAEHVEIVFSSDDDGIKMWVNKRGGGNLLRIRGIKKITIDDPKKVVITEQYATVSFGDEWINEEVVEGGKNEISM